MRLGLAVLCLTLAGPAFADKMPIFDEQAGYSLRSIEQGRVWMDQGKVTFLCTLAPAVDPPAMVLRQCQPLITPSRHDTFAVAHAAADTVSKKVSGASSAVRRPSPSAVEAKVSELEALNEAIAKLDAPALADRVYTYSKDLAALSGHGCVLEPAEMDEANAINAGQLLFLEFGIATGATEAVTLPLGMELEVRNYLDQLRYQASNEPGHSVTVERLTKMQSGLRITRERLREAHEALLRDGRHHYEGRAIRISACS